MAVSQSQDKTLIVERAKRLRHAMTHELADHLAEPEARVLAFSYLLWPPVTDDPDAGRTARNKRTHAPC